MHGPSKLKSATLIDGARIVTSRPPRICLGCPYLAPPLPLLYLIRLSKPTMQNASGLWGKVKSQAQQAGSMAQGAINVSPTVL
jgi:hypothetical protein